MHDPDPEVTRPDDGPGPEALAAAGTAPRLADVELAALATTLEQARAFGFLGPGPVYDQIWRSLAFAVVAPAAPGLAVDLGSGGGLPALVLAFAWKASHWLLVESNQRRSRWLETTVDRLGLKNRCEVLCERAEVVGRGANRHQVELVTARSFGPPAPTAECGAPLLRTGGQLLVSDPPDGAPGRWPEGGLALLGLQVGISVRVPTPAGPVALSRLDSISPCPDAYPRRVGVPSKRPLF